MKEGLKVLGLLVIAGAILYLVGYVFPNFEKGLEVSERNLNYDDFVFEQKGEIIFVNINLEATTETGISYNIVGIGEIEGNEEHYELLGFDSNGNKVSIQIELKKSTIEGINYAKSTVIIGSKKLENIIDHVDKDKLIELLNEMRQ